MARAEDILKNAWKVTPASLASYLTRDEVGADRFEEAPHIEFMSNLVASAVAGHGSKYIAISIPPQHAKSTTFSKWTMAWALENWPHRRNLLGSYSGDYAEVWGRRARDTIEKYRDRLTVRLNPATTAAGEWETTAGGGMVAVGVGGSATGRTADGILLIDDPFKDSKEANSATIRENVWDWLVNVALTRRGPDTVTILIHTRWHPDDTIGRIQRMMAEDPLFPRWNVINLPALAERNDPLGRAPGDPLWDRLDLRFLNHQKRMMGTYRWNALYQGHPTAPEGGLFKRSWFAGAYVNRSDCPPLSAMKLVRFWDLAATVEGEKGNSDPDWTVGMLMGMYKEVAYILDVVRFRRSSNLVEQGVASAAKRDTRRVKVRMQQDPSQAGKAQILHYARHVVFGYDFRGKPSSDGKVQRAAAFEAAFERGDVKIVRAPWNGDLEDELCEFPNGNHDDQADTCSGAYNELVGSGGGDWTGENLAPAFSHDDGSQGEAESNPIEFLEKRRRKAIAESQN